MLIKNVSNRLTCNMSDIFLNSSPKHSDCKRSQQSTHGQLTSQLLLSSGGFTFSLSIFVLALIVLILVLFSPYCHCRGRSTLGSSCPDLGSGQEQNAKNMKKKGYGSPRARCRERLWVKKESECDHTLCPEGHNVENVHT